MPGVPLTFLPGRKKKKMQPVNEERSLKIRFVLFCLFHYHSQRSENIFLEADASHLRVDSPCKLKAALPCPRGRTGVGGRGLLSGLGRAAGLASLAASQGHPLDLLCFPFCDVGRAVS